MQRNAILYCFSNAIHRLKRQTIDQIIINGIVADFSGYFCYHFHTLNGLNSVNSFLNNRIVILNAITDSSESTVKQCL